MAAIQKQKLIFQIPASSEEWSRVEKWFNKRWNCPGVYGAMDGKHAMIQAPSNCGSDFFSYKGNNILMVAIDNYCLWYINIGTNCRCLNGWVFQNCSIFLLNLKNNLLPKDGFFIGDDTFQLKTFVKIVQAKSFYIFTKNFNCRLSRARKIIKNAVGILVLFCYLKAPLLQMYQQLIKLLYIKTM